MINTTAPASAGGNPVLDTGRLYFAADRILCSECAGSTALHTGYTYDHHRLIAVTARDVAEWTALTDLPLTCACSRLQATIAIEPGPTPSHPSAE